MPGIDVDASKERVLLLSVRASRVLQLRQHLERVAGNNTVVVVRRHDETGRQLIFSSCNWLDIVQRKVLQHVLEVLLLVRVPEVAAPSTSDRVLVEGDHRDWHL